MEMMFLNACSMADAARWVQFELAWIAAEVEMFTRIVVPLDGSPLAETALPEATELARLSGAEIRLVRVIDFTMTEKHGAFGLALEYAPQQFFDVELEEAETYLRETADRLRGAGLTVSSEVTRGRVALVLANYCKPGDAVVMASHGRGGLSRWFLGSVAEDLVRKSTVPVMLVRAQKSIEPEVIAVPASNAAVLA
jgi:nucleotide-binding universal stress UspA family protein